MENSQDRTVIDGSSSPDDRAGQEADGSSPDDRAWQEADGCEGTVPLQTTIAARAYLICKEMLLSGEGFFPQAGSLKGRLSEHSVPQRDCP